MNMKAKEYVSPETFVRQLVKQQDSRANRGIWQCTVTELFSLKRLRRGYE